MYRPIRGVFKITWAVRGAKGVTRLCCLSCCSGRCSGIWMIWWGWTRGHWPFIKAIDPLRRCWEGYWCVYLSHVSQVQGMERGSSQRFCTSSNDGRINSRYASASNRIVVIIVVDLHYCFSGERPQTEYNYIIVPALCGCVVDVASQRECEEERKGRVCYKQQTNYCHGNWLRDF